MTSISKKIDKQCDSCSNQNIEIKRCYKGESYCANCYSIWFIKKPCSECGEISRLHKKEAFGVCAVCRINKPCTRCGGAAVKDGANTEYGRVCQTCYQGYFKTKTACFECGELKRNISRYSKLSHNQAVCTTCYQRHVMETCPLCRRYRELINTEKGRICQRCNKLGEIPCETCHELMPAGMGKSCNDCYWSQRLLHETEINVYLLSSEIMRQAYASFTEWFAANKGGMVATLKHNNFIEFFVRCDETWGKIPSYESLVQEFKPNGLRENLTVLRWLTKTEQVTVNPDVKQQIAEQERIFNLLAKFDGNEPVCIAAFHSFLSQKLLKNKTSLKSVRLALQPAIDLCIKYDLRSSNIPNQEHIDGYLLEKKGQFSALYGFITFLNKEYALSLKYERPSEKDIAKGNRKQLEKQIMDLANKVNLTKNDELLWYQLGLAYFHNVKISLRILRSRPLKEKNEGFVVLIFEEKEYWLPTASAIKVIKS